MTFRCAEGLDVENLGTGYLVLARGRRDVFELTGDEAEAFEMARSGVDRVPRRLERAMAGLVTLGIVEADAWSRRRVLQLGGAAAAAAVAVIALPNVAAATSPPSQQVSFDESTPGSYTLPVPADTPLTFTVIGGGGSSWYSSQVAGSDATQITGTLPAQPSAYTLSIVVAAGATLGLGNMIGAAGSGNPPGGDGTTTSGGGGGASSITGSGVLIVAPGGAGASTSYRGAPPTVSPANWDGSLVPGNDGGGWGGGGGDAVTAGLGLGGASSVPNSNPGSNGSSAGGGDGGVPPDGYLGGGGGGGGVTGGGGGGAYFNEGGGGGGSAIATGAVVDLGSGTYPVAVATTDPTAGQGWPRPGTNRNGHGRVTITSI